MVMCSFLVSESYSYRFCPTKRAPDAGDSVHIPSSFPRLTIFLAGRLRRPRPSAGNANRWALNRMQKLAVTKMRSVGYI